MTIYPPAVLSMQNPGLLQDHFQASLHLAIFLLSVTPIFFIFSTSSNHLFLGFPTDLFPIGIFLHTYFTVTSSDILSTFPNHLYLPFLISQIICFSTHIYQLLIGADPPHTTFFYSTKYPSRSLSFPRR